MGKAISNIAATGTTLEQPDAPWVSYLQAIGCGDVDFIALSSRELKFEEWCEKNAAKDGERLRRIAEATASIAKDALRVERTELIRRRAGRGFR